MPHFREYVIVFRVYFVIRCIMLVYFFFVLANQDLAASLGFCSEYSKQVKGMVTFNICWAWYSLCFLIVCQNCADLLFTIIQWIIVFILSLSGHIVVDTSLKGKCYRCWPIALIIRLVKFFFLVLLIWICWSSSITLVWPHFAFPCRWIKSSNGTLCQMERKWRA